MTTVTTLRPGPHHGCLAEIRRLRAQLRVADRRATYAAGYADGYREGRDTARLMDAYAEPSYAEIETVRWEVHGEPRTRETFSAPHPLDRYPLVRAGAA